jgi:hypothetical protein
MRRTLYDGRGRHGRISTSNASVLSAKVMLDQDAISSSLYAIRQNIRQVKLAPACQFPFTMTSITENSGHYQEVSQK